MKKILSILIIALNLGSICSAQENNPTIQNVRLFDGDSVYEDVTIITENGIIAGISQSPEIGKNSEKMIDGSGYTDLPE